MPGALDQALYGLGRVSTLVRSMKDFARVDRPDQRAKTPSDINRALAATLSIAHNEYKYVARVVTNFGDIPPVICHINELNQCFLNLIVNAAHAIREGSAQENEIRLSTSMDGPRVVIEVTDTGSGISPALLPRLFNAFITTKAPGQGTGLGLSISRRIVTALGGEITGHSEGRGATFRVTLPGTDQHPVAFDTSGSNADLTGIVRSRILVVDDEVMVTNAIRRIIGNTHDIVVVFRAQDALRRISSGEAFDLILCDLLMPEMTGMALFHTLALLAPQQGKRMLFMTGGTFSADAAAFVDAQSDRVIEKPFDRATLMAAISGRLKASQVTQ
jgi:CheY-like chemotaxis protein